MGNVFGLRSCGVVAVLGSSAVAQDEKNDIGGMIGRTFISDQGIQNATYFDPIIHSGNGLTFEGEYARRFFVTPVFAISAEGLLAYNHEEKLNAGAYGFAVVPQAYKELFVVPAARVNLFPTTAVSPWASVGAGFGYITQSPDLVYGGVNPGKSTTSAVVEGGLGSGCEGLEQAQHAGRSPRFLVRGTGFSAGSDWENPAAQLFCGRRSVLALLESHPL